MEAKYIISTRGKRRWEPNMEKILNEIKDAKTIGIGGHVRPDGDCVGSCMAMYHYLKKNLSNNIKLDVYLEEVPKRFAIIKDTDIIKQVNEDNIIYDLFISLDSGSLDRLGGAEAYFNQAKVTINIDHHISNTEFGMNNHVVPDASSTCEVLFDLFDEDKIDQDVATALYLGIIHDTGVFKHTNTTKKTMNIAGKLIDKNVPFSKMIDETFYLKNYVQNQILGRCLLKSMLILDNKCIVSYLSKNEMELYGATSSDLDGVIDQLRITEGVEVAIFLYELDFQEFKVSMRSNGIVDVRKIVQNYNGGGHTKAAGCSMRGTVHDVINGLTGYIECQLLDDMN